MAGRAIRGVANNDPAQLLSDMMVSLNDTQLKTVMSAAARVPHEKRDLFLRRTASMLELRRGRRRRYDDRDVEEISQRALVGLVHEHEPAA